MEESSAPNPEPETIEKASMTTVNNEVVVTEEKNTGIPVKKFADSRSVEVPKEIRPWMASLSANELARALGFTDGPMIAALLELSRASLPSSSSGSPSSEKGDDEQTADPSDLHEIDWKTLVSLTDIEKTLRFMSTATTTHQSPSADCAVLTEAESDPTCIDQCDSCSPNNDSDHRDVNDVKVPESAPCVEVEAAIASGDDIKEDGAEGSVDPDDFRIRVLEKEPLATDDDHVKPDDVEVKDVKPDDVQTDDIKREEALEMEVKPNIDGTATDDSDDKPSDEPSPAPVLSVDTSSIPSSKVKLMMENVCAMFPVSADGSRFSEGIAPPPFITIQPSYLATISGEDLLFAFDEIMFPLVVTNESFAFLSNPTLSVYSSWLEGLGGTANITSPDARSIPLYMLLLSRFQTSVYEAFQNRINHVALIPEKDSLVDLETAGILQTSGTPKDEAESTEVDCDGVISPEVPAVSDEMNTASGTDETALNPMAVSVEKRAEEAETAEVNTNNDSSPDPTMDLVGGISDHKVDDNSLECTKEDKLNENEPDATLVQAPSKTLCSESPKADSPVSVNNVAGGDFASVEERPEHFQTSPLVSLVGNLRAQGSNDQILFMASKEFLASLSPGSLDLPKANEVEASPDVDGEDSPSPQTPKDVEDKTPASNETKVDPEWIDEPVPAAPSSGQSPKKNAKKKKKKKKRKGSNADASPQVKESTADNDEPKQHDDRPEPKEAAAKETESTVTADEIGSQSKVGGAEDGIPASNFDSGAEALPSLGENDPHKNSALIKDHTQPPSGGSAPVSKVGIDVSRVEGVGTTVAVAQPHPEEAKAASPHKKDAAASNNADVSKDDHAWETVEVRGRGSRKKPSDRGGHGRFHMHQHQNHGFHGQHGQKKSKAARTSASRKRTANRKIVRDILSSVLDAVDDEVRRRRQLSRDGARPTGNNWAGALVRNKMNSSFTRNGNANDMQQQPGNPSKESTMRDILVGRQTGNPSKSLSASAAQYSQRMHSDRMRLNKHGVSGRNPNEHRRGREKAEKNSPGGGTKPGGQTTLADQNTAPTVQETLSAVSANSVNTDAFRGSGSQKDAPVRETGAARSDSSSGGSAEVLKPQQSSSTSQVGKEGSPPPPLPTLLSPGNANSASSSVASSLDAPHAGHPHHHCFSTANENDVGYHLLDVCERLTREMSVFMTRRSHALNVRRNERGAVLGALQNSLSNLWPGRCNVEMYGSCATQLDLPSSDLDVVICGLDRPVDIVLNAPTSEIEANQEKSSANKDDTIRDTLSSDSSNAPHESHKPSQHQATPYQPQQHIPMMYGHHLSLNAERVMRLAVELEQQPWAVHVKAIPTATVPVIKILADPARLAVAMSSGNSSEWLLQQQQSSAQTVVAGNRQSGENVEVSPPHQQSIPHFHPSQATPPWRGADVVNGLLKVDITFEGPEHGGIGSTEFSSRVVQEFCNETGLEMDGTPMVQVLMVLKELLAQRRLNEPFSGGLSSYALLLLVISVMRERTVIREELERVERQRKVVAAGGGNSTVRGFSSEPGSSQPPLAPKVGASTTDRRDQKGVSRRQTKAKKQPADEKNLKSQNLSASSQQPALKSTVDSKKGVGESAKNSQSPKVPGDKETGPAQQVLSDKPDASGPGRATADTAKATNPKRSPSPASSWASIARKTSAPTQLASKGDQNKASETKTPPQKKPPAPVKKGSFADAVAKGTPAAAAPAPASAPAALSGANARVFTPATPPPDRNNGKNTNVSSQTPKEESSTKKDAKPKKNNTSDDANKLSTGANSKKPESADQGVVSKLNVASPSFDIGLGVSPSVFPQGFHDVIEVLCSGETTAGKLLMHFLLFYGQHFDPQSTAIDYSGKHERDFSGNTPYSHLSPYMQRRTAGTYDPVTGMLTVDPIVVYDPLEGAENNNVSRSCFCWSNIRWVFAQSYMTLSNAVEMSATPSIAQTIGTKGNQVVRSHSSGTTNGGKPPSDDTWNGPYSQDDAGNMMVDPSASLLELLLSY